MAVGLLAGGTTTAYAMSNVSNELAGVGIETTDINDKSLIKTSEVEKNTRVQEKLTEETLTDVKLDEAMLMPLVSVSHDDKSKFTSEEWKEILSQIEQGKIMWED